MQWKKGVQVQRMSEWLVLPTDGDTSPGGAVRAGMALLPLQQWLVLHP